MFEYQLQRLSLFAFLGTIVLIRTPEPSTEVQILTPEALSASEEDEMAQVT
jgi:hypothetical protein